MVIDWDSLAAEQVQVGVREAKRAGAEATAFIWNGFQMKKPDFFRETGEFAFHIPALPRPALDAFRNFESVESLEDTSPTEAVVALKLGTVLRANEKSIGAGQYQYRIIRRPGVLLGFQHATWLVEHQNTFPEFVALIEKLYRIDFLGLRVNDGSGHQSFPCLISNGNSNRWELRWEWSGCADLDRHKRIAIAGK